MLDQLFHCDWSAPDQYYCSVRRLLAAEVLLDWIKVHPTYLGGRILADRASRYQGRRKGRLAGDRRSTLVHVEQLAAGYPYQPAYLPVNRLLDGTMHKLVSRMPCRRGALVAPVSRGQVCVDPVAGAPPLAIRALGRLQRPGRRSPAWSYPT
jgi:hypothetical protein